MFNYVFLTGLLGSFILILGAAWPDQKEIYHVFFHRVKNWLFSFDGHNPKINPTKSVKNWLLAIGGFIMLIYAILGYLQGGAVFFVFLEIFIAIASILMMLNTDDRLDFIMLVSAGIGFIIWSLYPFEGYNMIFFIIGLMGIGLGYSFTPGTLRRNVALTAGGFLIAIFSYFEANWIFFWLNIFFSILSALYVIKRLINSKKMINKINVISAISGSDLAPFLSLC